MKPRDDGERESNYSEFLHENLIFLWRLTVPHYFRQWLVACPTPNIYREICFHFAYCVVKGKHSWNSDNNGVTSFYRNILMKIWSVIPLTYWCPNEWVSSLVMYMTTVISKPLMLTRALYFVISTHLKSTGNWNHSSYIGHAKSQSIRIFCNFSVDINIRCLRISRYYLRYMSWSAETEWKVWTA